MLLRATVGAGRRVRVPAQVAERRAPRLQLAWERLASTKWSLGISASANCVERERVGAHRHGHCNDNDTQPRRGCGHVSAVGA